MISLVNAIGNICICPGEGLPKVSQQLLKWSILTSYAKNGPDSLVKLLHQAFPFKTIPSTLAILTRRLGQSQGSKQNTPMPSSVNMMKSNPANFTHFLQVSILDRKMQHDVWSKRQRSHSTIFTSTSSQGQLMGVMATRAKIDLKLLLVCRGQSTPSLQKLSRKVTPRTFFDALSPGIIRAIEANCKWKPEEVILHRARWLKKWTNRAMELAKEEHHLHDRLPPHRKKILDGKRLLVLKEILEDEGYPDGWFGARDRRRL